MANDKLVKAELPSGFAEYGGAALAARNRMVEAILRVYRRYGFTPLDTSIVQRTEVLVGEEGDNILWETRRSTSKDPATESLRFDLTVGLARYVAEHATELTFPFKRCEDGYVFRGEAAQIGKGRFNGFIQCDADIVGAPMGTADAEIVLCMADVMAEIGVERFVIKLNNRKVLDGLVAKLGYAIDGDDAKGILRVLDKADKKGVDGVVAILQQTVPSTEKDGDPSSFAFDDAKAAMVREFMTLTDGMTTNEERLGVLGEYFGNEGIGAEGVAELELLARYITAGGIRPDVWVVDTSVVRGLSYYTGTVFEMILPDAVPLGIGSVYSGGRYDYLLSRFTRDSMPCVGASVGVTRLFAALSALGLLGEPEPTVDVYILSMDAALTDRYFALAAEARAAGLRVEIGMSHQDMSMKAQMGTALKRGAPIVAFFGGNEAATHTMQLKDTRIHKQVTVPLAEWVEKAKEILG